MLNFLTNKQKGIIGTVTLMSLGIFVIRGLYEYSSYKILKNIENKLKKNSWEYYE